MLKIRKSETCLERVKHANRNNDSASNNRRSVDVFVSDNAKSD